MIAPILAYNSEMWRMYAKPDFKTWDSSQIEKSHPQICTRFSELSLSNKASNFASKTDLGRLPTLHILSLKMKSLSLSNLF